MLKNQILYTFVLGDDDEFRIVPKNEREIHEITDEDFTIEKESNWEYHHVTERLEKMRRHAILFEDANVLFRYPTGARVTTDERGVIKYHTVKENQLDVADDRERLRGRLKNT